MMIKNFFYKVNGIEYPVIVTYKRIKNIIFKFKDGQFLISTPRFVLKSTLVKGLDKYALSLLNRNSNRQNVLPFTDKYIYLFGKLIELNKEGGIIEFINREPIKYSSILDLEKKLKKFFLEVITSRVRYWEKEMGLPSYKIRVSKMKTRFGSNSRKTNTLNFNFSLIHFRSEISDTVIIHELAHIVHFDHSKNFYNLIYKYCPEYKKLQRYLKEERYDA